MDTNFYPATAKPKGMVDNSFDSVCMYHRKTELILMNT